MPSSPLRPCPCSPTCTALLPHGVRRCQQGAVQQERSRYNPEARRWYHTARWKALREDVLTDNPLCVACQQQGRVSIATDVDHITPHRGHESLFWQRTNLQGLCASCHSTKTGRGE